MHQSIVFVLASKFDFSSPQLLFSWWDLFLRSAESYLYVQQSVNSGSDVKTKTPLSHSQSGGMWYVSQPP